MPKLIFGNIERLEDRHPGLCRQLEAMFDASISHRKIAAAIRAQYGERISRDSIGTYKRADWNVRRALNQAGKAAELGAR